MPIEKKGSDGSCSFEDAVILKRALEPQEPPPLPLRLKRSWITRNELADYSLFQIRLLCKTTFSSSSFPQRRSKAKLLSLHIQLDLPIFFFYLILYLSDWIILQKRSLDFSSAKESQLAFLAPFVYIYFKEG